MSSKTQAEKDAMNVADAAERDRLRAEWFEANAEREAFKKRLGRVRQAAVEAGVTDLHDAVLWLLDQVPDNPI